MWFYGPCDHSTASAPCDQHCGDTTGSTQRFAGTGHTTVTATVCGPPSLGGDVLMGNSQKTEIRLYLHDVQ